jgi:hypothetical protein
MVISAIRLLVLLALVVGPLWAPGAQAQTAAGPLTITVYQDPG